MSSQIRVLDDHTINTIAAGEVIENPSSVVKELIENALDAGATNVTVEVKAGGRQMIRISDNGKGMNHDDTLLCLERHATSKIRSAADLTTIHSMGFRGEAIPSIAAISKFTLISNGSDAEDKASMVLVDGGSIIKHCDTVRTRGTTVEIKSLFFNVPVRKKFQKTISADNAAVHKVISAHALCNPAVKFTFISNDTKIFALSPWSEDIKEGMKQRINELLGEEFSSSLIPISYQEGPYDIQGFIGMPSMTRHNKTGQHLFINNRPVISPVVSSAVTDAYSTALATHRHPLFVLHLAMDPELVDINVHPQKRDVRFQDKNGIRSIVMRAIREAMHISSDPAPTSEHIYMPTPQPRDDLPWEPIPAPSEAATAEEHTQELFSSSKAIDLSSRPTPEIVTEELSYEEELFTVEAEEEGSAEPISVHIVATLPDYIFATLPHLGEEALYVVDQRAAHSRILYDKLTEKKQNEGITSQSLLIPLTLEFSPADAALIEENLEAFTSLGVGVALFGKNTFIVDAIPTMLREDEVEEMLSKVLEDIKGNIKTTSLSQEREKSLSRAVSRASLPKGKRLPPEQAHALVAALMKGSSPYTSPYGEATILPLDGDDLAKHFSRKKALA
jgi:DNA mismatch repair protein MutL